MSPPLRCRAGRVVIVLLAASCPYCYWWLCRRRRAVLHVVQCAPGDGRKGLECWVLRLWQHVDLPGRLARSRRMSRCPPCHRWCGYREARRPRIELAYAGKMRLGRGAGPRGSTQPRSRGARAESGRGRQCDVRASWNLPAEVKNTIEAAENVGLIRPHQRVVAPAVESPWNSSHDWCISRRSWETLPGETRNRLATSLVE